VSQPDFRAKLVLKAVVSPSEDTTKVKEALHRIIGEAPSDPREDAGMLGLVTEDARAFARLRDQLRDRHVRSAARKQLLVNSLGASTSLMLNRQAAAAGVIAICSSPEESPLGPVYVTIESDNVEKVIDWLTAYSG